MLQQRIYVCYHVLEDIRLYKMYKAPEAYTEMGGCPKHADIFAATWSLCSGRTVYSKHYTHMACQCLGALGVLKWSIPLCETDYRWLCSQQSSHNLTVGRLEGHTCTEKHTDNITSIRNIWPCQMHVRQDIWGETGMLLQYVHGPKKNHNWG